MTNDPIIVIGAGGHAKVVLSTLLEAGRNVSRVLDDDPSRWGEDLLGVKILGPVKEASSLTGPAVLAIGDNRTRRRLTEILDVSWVTVVHPNAWVHESVEIGPGTVVFSGALLQPGTKLGAHAIVNTGAIVDHDCEIGDFVHLGPGVRLAGSVVVGEGAFLGIGSCATPGVDVGAWSVIGAGAAVVGDIPNGVVATGVPAAALRKLE